VRGIAAALGEAGATDLDGSQPVVWRGMD